jgi:hypothetical protein
MTREARVDARYDASGAAALARRGGAHPDLVERLLVVVPPGTVALGDDQAVAARSDGRVFAFATGMSSIVLRLGREPRIDLAVLGAAPWGTEGWWACSAWLTDLPTAAGLALLRAACAAAHAAAGEAR